MNNQIHDLIKKAYSGFNSRNIDQALSTFHPNVQWPKAFEGGYVNGQNEIRKYWTKQWTEINPIVEIIKISEKDLQKYEVTVHQLVRDLQKKVLFDGVIKHIFTVQDDLLVRMDIELE